MPPVRSAVASLCLVFVCALIALAPLPAAAGDGLPRPELTVERVDGVSRVFVETVLPDGSRDRSLLRVTASPVEPGATGRDPAGRAAFATWLETATGETFAAWSRDAGKSWTEGRPVALDVRLRDGAARPGDLLPPAPAGWTLPPGGRVFLVQLRTISLPEWRDALEAAGAEIVGFVPHATHLVRIDPARVAELSRLDFVARVAPYQPWYRVSRELRDWIAAAPADAPPRRVRVVAFEWGPAGKQRIAAAAAAFGAEVAAFWPSGHVLELWASTEQVKKIAALDDVEWIDSWSPPETDMDLVREDAGDNWVEDTYGYCGQGVRGEVMDAGIEQDHMDFDGILMHTAASVASHGTSTYGIVFGNGDRDGDGEAKGTGHMPCPEAQGIFADYDEVSDRYAHTEELKHDPYFASFQTNSWGNARTRHYNSYSEEMDDIIWRLDIAILQSQSNAGNQDSRPQAWAKNIISVGGVKHYDTLDTSDDCWCSGASIGPAEDGRIKPDVSYWYDDIYTTTTGNGYTSTFGGTSAATPESAGVLGLIVQLWSENAFGTDPEGETVFERQPHASTMKALLINTAEQYPFSGEGHDLTRVHQGWGRPSVRNAKERGGNSFIVDEAERLQVGDVARYEVQVEAGEPELKVTLVYPDPPGTTSSTMHRINDLDLRVTSPSGTLYHGNWGLKAANYSEPGGERNEVDTVENVFVENPEEGTWVVEVEAMEVNEDGALDTPEDDVTFALVVTGATGQVCDGPTADFTADPNPARVGQEIQFDGTASGGAGGPYTYRWDFDDDGKYESEEEDPVHVYHRPWEGPVTMRAKDSEGCPSDKVQHTVTVTGPDIRYEDYVDLTEVEGNGNGKLDPGETWEVTVRLRNRGNEDGLGITADLAVNPETPGPVTLTVDASTFGDMPVDFVAAGAPAYRFRIGQEFPCGNDIVFDLVNIRSTDPVNRYPDQPAVFRLLVGGAGDPVTFWSDGFETSTGWSFHGAGEWQIDSPRGLGGGTGVPGQPTPVPDPDSAFAGEKVLGNDLTGLGSFPGNYEALVDASTATSPPLDCSNAAEITMHFARWLNTAPRDLAYLDVSADGGANWTTLWSSSEGVRDEDWILVVHDVSEWADGNPNFRVRFGLTTDGAVQFSGWNVDEFFLEGVTKDSCEPFAVASPGVIDGLTVARNEDGSLHLAWGADCGAGTAGGVYRGDLHAGWSSAAPEPGACEVTGGETDVPAGDGDAQFFVVVPNDGAFEGSYGTDSAGARREPPAATCFPEDAIDACAP